MTKQELVRAIRPPVPGDTACPECGGPSYSHRRRKLCWHCYQNPAVRDKYPPLLAANGIKLPTGRAAEPTDALPGTAAKLAVLEQRYADGQELWHPDDAVVRRPSHLRARDLENGTTDHSQEKGRRR